MTFSLKSKTSALIVAAGDGTRLGNQPKALVTVGGITLVERVAQSLQEFASQIIVAVREVDVDAVRNLVAADVEVRG